MIPETFDVPLKTHNELNGIINRLRDFYKINTLDYVVPSSFYDRQGDKKTLVLWDSLLYQSGNDNISNAWFQLTFSKNYIYPSSYSMRGVYDGKGTYFCPTSWVVYGIYYGDEDKQDKWVELGVNNISESIYCNNMDSNGGCSDKNIGTFMLKRKNYKKGFKHMRWQLLTTIKYYYFATSGVDIYGSLSFCENNKCRANCKTSYCRCSRHQFIVVILFSNLIS